MEDRQSWARWLEAAGVPDAGAVHGPVLNRASMLIDAAVDGQGVALARTTLAAWDLINGRLVRPFPRAAVDQDLLDRLPEGDGSLPKIAAFRDWLLAEAGNDVERLKADNEANTVTAPGYGFGDLLGGLSFFANCHRRARS